MKIAQVIPSFELAGAETMCANLSIELQKKGHNVVAISLYDCNTSIVERITQNGVKFISLGKKKGIDFRFVIKFAKILLNFKPDVIHSHLYATKYALFLAFLFRIKRRVFTIHNEAHKDGTKVDHFFNNFFVKIGHAIPVTLSNDLVESACKIYGNRLRTMPVVFNGVPLNSCKPKVFYEKKAIHFLHIGRFSAAKNHESIIQAFVCAQKKCSDIQLDLYGEGPLMKPMKELVKQLHASDFIHFCGLTSDIYSVMYKADVFLLPSLWEGVPMTLIEAMGTGLPIISSHVGGVPNLLQHDVEALLVEPEKESIEEAIVSLYDNVEKRKIMGRNALTKSKEFDSTSMASNYENVYRNI